MNKFAKIQSDKIDQKILKIFSTLVKIREEYADILNDPSKLDQEKIDFLVNLIKTHDSQQENLKMSLEAFFKYVSSLEDDEDGDVVSEETEDGNKI